VARLAWCTTYLGRPTSPVLINVVDGEPEDDHRDVWAPDEDGTRHLGIATPRLLLDLDQREHERRVVGVVGHHPPLSGRPRARYQVRVADAGHQLIPEPANAGVVADVLANCVEVGIPRGDPSDVMAIAAQLPAGTRVMPLFSRISARGITRSRLHSVLVFGELSVGLFLVRPGEVIELAPGLPRSLTSARTAISRSWGAARAWTTLVPVANDAEVLVRQAHDCARRAGTTLLEVTTHAVSRVEDAPEAGYLPGMTHASILFENPVVGPVPIDRGFAVPFAIE
jgi:CRISPR-associated protein Csb2